MDAGFCAIPVVKFQPFMQWDYQLNLVEIYLTKLKFSMDMKAKNHKDFGFLGQFTRPQSPIIQPNLLQVPE